jgi:CubicO group peptidase (beta-lactamase class C family)
VSELGAFRDRHKIAAVGAALVTADGAVELTLIGGRVHGGDPVQAADAWHIGSCGKSMTAALYARLVEQGEAEWGVPVARLFPDLDAHPGWDAVTIDDLFVGEGGVRPDLHRKALAAATADTRTPVAQRTDVAAAVLAGPPERPGRFRYSNLGYMVIGAAIERIAGVPYERALQAELLEPLGMTTAGFGAPPAIRGHRGRTPAPPDDPRSDNPPVMGPCGRVHLSLQDWARFQQLFISEGAGFLEPASIERLLTPAQAQSPGWAPARGLAHVSMGQQGSNTFWVATALIDRDRERTVMVVCNDGRRRLLAGTAKLAARLLPAS